LVPNAVAARVKHILILGDSLSAEYGIARDSGWVKLLEKSINQKNATEQIKIINASISGETTSGGLKRLPQLIEKDQPDLIILELGANDALRGLALEATKENIRNMILQAQRAKAKVLLLGMEIPPNYGRPYRQQFKAVFKELADLYGVPLIPFFLEPIAHQRELFQSDGLHPNEQAQDALMQPVKHALVPML